MYKIRSGKPVIAQDVLGTLSTASGGSSAVCAATEKGNPPAAFSLAFGFAAASSFISAIEAFQNGGMFNRKFQVALLQGIFSTICFGGVLLGLGLSGKEVKKMLLVAAIGTICWATLQTEQFAERPVRFFLNKALETLKKETDEEAATVAEETEHLLDKTEEVEKETSTPTTDLDAGTDDDTRENQLHLGAGK